MSRDRVEAERLVANANARIGETSSHGRITETLMGAVLVTRDLGGRPIHIVSPIIHNHDPLYDGNLSRSVLAARRAYAARAETR
jgi:hypothetical protein